MMAPSAENLGLHVCLMHSQPLVNAGLSVLVSAMPGMSAAIAGGADGARGRGDIVVADYRQGLRLAAAHPQQKIVVLTGLASACHVTTALRRGVHGYLLHGCDGAELAAALRCVAGGGIHVAAALGATMAARPSYHLTGREADILRLLSRGDCNKSIARALGISEGTVKSHLKRLFQKLQARGRMHAVVVAADLGLTDDA